MLQGHSGGAIKQICVKGLECACNPCSSEALKTKREVRRVSMGRDPDSTDEEDRLHAWMQGQDASSVETWLQSGENSDDACNDSGGSTENWVAAGTSGFDQSLSDDSRQALQLRQGTKRGETQRAVPGTGRQRPISNRGGEALWTEPQQVPVVEGGNVDVGVLQHRSQGASNSGHRRPPQRHVGGNGGEQTGRRAPSGDQRRRLCNTVGHGADILGPHRG